MDKSGESKDFLASLEKRVEHLQRRKERIESYCAADPKKLDAEQMKAVQSREEIDGMLKEAVRVEKAYRSFLARKKHEDEQKFSLEFERGHQTARLHSEQTRQRDFATISDFLRLVSQQYAQNARSALSRAEVTALVLTLQAMYSGGLVGAETMAKLANGSKELVGSTQVSYENLQRLTLFEDSSEGPSEPSSDLSSLDSSDNESLADAKSPELESNTELKKPDSTEKAAETVETRPTSYADVVAMGPSHVKVGHARSEPKPKPKARSNYAATKPARGVEPSSDAKPDAKKLDEKKEDDLGFQLVTRPDRSRRKNRTDNK